LADCLRLVLREIKAAPLPFPSGHSAGRPRPISWSIRGALKMTTDAVSVVVVVLFALFVGAVSYIIRPRNRRQSRRPVALSAAADSPDPPFIERRRASRFSRLRDFFLRRRRWRGLLAIKAAIVRAAHTPSPKAGQRGSAFLIAVEIARHAAALGAPETPSATELPREPRPLPPRLGWQRRKWICAYHFSNRLRPATIENVFTHGGRYPGVALQPPRIRKSLSARLPGVAGGISKLPALAPSPWASASP
jgi:hypothetical protein